MRADQCLRPDGNGSSGNIINALADAWGAILALDYKPVFQTAIAGILGPNPDDNWRRAVGIIAQEALNLTGNLAGGRHDVMGRIFHRVLDTAPYDGSFYTGVAGATLLATLAIRPDDRDWTDNAALRRMVITDPACGTGTLPIAAAARIRELAGSGMAGSGAAGGNAGGRTIRHPGGKRPPSVRHQPDRYPYGGHHYGADVAVNPLPQYECAPHPAAPARLRCRRAGNRPRPPGQPGMAGQPPPDGALARPVHRAARRYPGRSARPCRPPTCSL